MPNSAAARVHRTTHIVLPSHTNALGAIFGGVLMSWIDIAAAVAAMRHSGRVCVTASIDELHFQRPIRTGYIVDLDARVTAVHRTSCEVMVEVTGENPMTRNRFRTARAFLTFVAIDDEGKPTPMPNFEPQNSEEKKLMEQAALRRRSRLQLRKKMDAMSPSSAASERAPQKVATKRVKAKKK